MLSDLEKWRKAGATEERRRWELLSDSDRLYGDAVICRLRWIGGGRECGIGMRDENHVAAIDEALRRFKDMTSPRTAESEDGE